MQQAIQTLEVENDEVPPFNNNHNNKAVNPFAPPPYSSSSRPIQAIQTIELDLGEGYSDPVQAIQTLRIIARRHPQQQPYEDDQQQQYRRATPSSVSGPSSYYYPAGFIDSASAAAAGAEYPAASSSGVAQFRLFFLSRSPSLLIVIPIASPSSETFRRYLFCFIKVPTESYHD